MSNGAPLTDYDKFVGQIAEWANRADWSPDLLASFVRMAEQKLNSELRIDRMIQFDDGLILNRCAPLPDDWLEMDLVRMASSVGADGFVPIRYKSRDEFFNLTDSRALNYYTIEGRQIYFGGTPNPTNGTEFKIAYYAEVPVFSPAQPSWIFTKYPNLYLFAALMHTALHAVGEEQSAANYKQLTEDMITKLNNDHRLAKASGSRVTRPRGRSFG